VLFNSIDLKVKLTLVTLTAEKRTTLMVDGQARSLGSAVRRLSG